MPEKRRFLDVWIVDSNTVYREVPFTVVADWVQQGRLLGDDKLRPSGTAEWYRIGATTEFSPYLPRAEPLRAEDQAEALEPVQLDFSFKRPREDEEGDVDMIPLIDVSLVLLIYFMLTAGVAGAAAFIKTPAADNGEVVQNTEGVWVGIDLEPDGKTPIYSVGTAGQGPGPDDKNLNNRDDALARLQEILKTRTGKVDCTILANPDVHSGLVRAVTVALEKEPFRKEIKGKFIGVSETTP